MLGGDAINDELRTHQLGVCGDWRVTDEVALFHRFFEFINVRCFPDQPLPTPAFSVEPSRSRIEFGHYREGRDGLGLCHHINISAQVVGQFGRLELPSIIAHELCHESESVYGTPPTTVWYHSKAWCNRAARLGLIAARGRGHTLQLTDPFVAICRELGIGDAVPDCGRAAGCDSDALAGLAPPKSRSTLAKWSCECQPPVNVWVGRADVNIRCEDCDALFHKTSAK